MTRNKPKMMQPVSVGDIYPVVRKSKKKDVLQGFKLTVTYDGFIPNNSKKLSQMGLISGGRGSKWTFIESDTKKHQTVVEYFFRNGLFMPEPLNRANKLRDNVQGMIDNFKPVSVSEVHPKYNQDFFGELYVVGYSVTLSYPMAAQNNPYFKQFIAQQKPKVGGISCNQNAKVVYVEYLFTDKKAVDLDDVRHNAQMFQVCMAAIARKRYENTK